MADLSVLALISLCLLTISINFSDSKPVSGFSLKLIHIHSPAGNLSQLERVERLVKVSKEKAAYVQSLSRNSTYDHQKLTLPINRHFPFYYGEVGIGKPPVYVKLLIDAGSGLIWTQCEPCLMCYNQGSHRYNTQFSDTYQILPCLPKSGGVDVYAPVIRAFEDYHTARHILHKQPESGVEFELCYYYPPEGFNDYPTLTYHFEGADYVVDGKNVLVHFPGPAQKFFCVGVKKTEGWSVLGALLMQDKRIIVDGMNTKIQFYTEQCIYDIYN